MLLTATEQLRALDQRKISSRDLVDQAIERIESLNPALNAIVVRDFEDARQAAVSADSERRSGSVKALLGLPVTVKEGFDLVGHPTAWGLPGNIPDAKSDAVLVSRLREAGAIVLGKSNVPVMLADWQTNNPRYGRTNNPWDLSLTPGGSTGGGAAAVSAGMVALEFGSDLAGSLRVPAAFCGVSAHRPTWGLIPMRGFAPPMAPRLPVGAPVDQAVVGPIARSAEDLQLALQTLAGPDGPDKSAYRIQLPSAPRTHLRDFRVLVIEQHPFCETSASITQSVASVAKLLESKGASVARHASGLPSLEELVRISRALLMAMMAADTDAEAFANAAADPNADTDTLSMTMRHRDWVRLDRERLGLQVRWLSLFSEFDALICPATPVTAFAHDDRPMQERRLFVDGAEVGYESLPLWSVLTNPTGLPSTTMPVGTDARGLPIGMQIIGAPYADLTTLRLSMLLERELGRFPSPPAASAA